MRTRICHLWLCACAHAHTHQINRNPKTKSHDIFPTPPPIGLPEHPLRCSKSSSSVDSRATGREMEWGVLGTAAPLTPGRVASPKNSVSAEPLNHCGGFGTENHENAQIKCRADEDTAPQHPFTNVLWLRMTLLCGVQMG